MQGPAPCRPRTSPSSTHHLPQQEAVAPDSPELGLALYQLAVTYYAQGMLAEAGEVLSRGTALARQHFPDGHDMVGLREWGMGTDVALLEYACGKQGNSVATPFQLGRGCSEEPVSKHRRAPAAACSHA